ncbi:MAG TPA: alpha/beta hydrolase [Kofleriaceae bacterium]
MGVSIGYFDGHRLLGSLHAAPRARDAALLCNPFGEEAARSHRTLRVLATQLERIGISAMRFDYGATGDSRGDGASASIAGWLADVATAAEHLRRETGARRLVIVGLRFGATLAALASTALAPHRLVLWDPVIDGRAYLAELAAQHGAYMREELGPAWHDRRVPGTPTEALGTPISAAFAAELAAIDLASTPIAGRCTVVTTKPAPGTERLRAHLARSAQWVELSDTTTWNSDAALNAMVVPMSIVQAIVARIEQSSHDPD